jgi:iron(II)-dependent oxidoreductase
MFFAVVIVLLLGCGSGFAQGAKPWEQPGTQAGQVITGPDGGKMVWVPTGEFMMGGQAGEDSQPAHRVRISKGFWLGQCTVTNAQYRQYGHDTGVAFPTESNEGDDHPVVDVIWSEAQAYCQHYGLSLPT